MNNSGTAVVTHNMVLAVANGVLTSDELVITLLYATSQLPGGDTIQHIAKVLGKPSNTLTKCLSSLAERRVINYANGMIDLSPLFGFQPNTDLAPKKAKPISDNSKTVYQVWEEVNEIVPCPKESSLGIIRNLLKTYCADDIIGCYTDIAKNPRNKQPNGYVNVDLKIVAKWIVQWKARKLPSNTVESDPLAHLYQE